MSTQTEHLNLDLREASDIFNPLSTNANFETLDNVIYEIQTKGGVPTYTTTASANLLKLSDNPTPNVTVFKFVAAGDANTWSYQETVNNIISLDGTQKTVKAGEMYVAWVNSANAMVVIAWPDVVNAQTFDGKGPTEWATTAQLQAVNTTATNATTTAQAAATVANNALDVANANKLEFVTLYTHDNTEQEGFTVESNRDLSTAKFFIFTIYFGIVNNVCSTQVVRFGSNIPSNSQYLRAQGTTTNGAEGYRSAQLGTSSIIHVGAGYYSGSRNNAYCIVKEIIAVF